MSRLKQRLAQGEMVVGPFVAEVRNPNLAYMLAHSGFDFFILDNEHGSFSIETVGVMIAGARGAGIDVVVRVPEIGREAILKPLDLGAAGLLIPMVDRPSQAEEVMAHAKYPPRGKRGVGLRRAHSFYKSVDAADYLEQANAETFIAVQAETAEAVENAAAIAAVDGVDAIFVGPMDLSVSLEMPGRTNDPAMVAAIERVVAACRQEGIAPGLLSFDPAGAINWIKKGMRFVAYSSDINLLADGASAALGEIRRGAED